MRPVVLMTILLVVLLGAPALSAADAPRSERGIYERAAFLNWSAQCPEKPFVGECFAIQSGDSRAYVRLVDVTGAPVAFYAGFSSVATGDVVGVPSVHCGEADLDVSAHATGGWQLWVYPLRQSDAGDAEGCGLPTAGLVLVDWT